MANDATTHPRTPARRRKSADKDTAQRADKEALTNRGEARVNSRRLQPQRQHGQHTSEANGCTIKEKIERGEWWPFDRADPKIIHKIHREKIMNIGEALW
jgi:hypothetical protein